MAAARASIGGCDRAPLRSSHARSTSLCGWRSPAPRSRQAFSRASLCSVARRPFAASTLRSPAELGGSSQAACPLNNRGEAADRTPDEYWDGLDASHVERCHAHASNSDKAPKRKHSTSAKKRSAPWRARRGERSSCRQAERLGRAPPERGSRPPFDARLRGA